MSSILTNTGAMVALQTLRTTNMGLEKAQSEISTGKSIASAKDNSAIWAISKVMDSDVRGFKAISQSLALGESTVAVGRQAAESVTDLLTQMKEKIVASQEDNVDRAKIQTDVAALREQISSVVSAAQFNGQNLVNGTALATEILSSLDRDAAGSVTASSIAVTGVNLSTGGYVANDVFSGSSTGATGDGDGVAFALDNGGGNEQLEIAENGTAFVEGETFSVRIGEQSVSYTVSASDAAATTTADIVAVALKNKIDALGIADLTVDYDSGTPGTLDFTNGGTADMTVTGSYKNAGTGDLAAMAAFDVSDAAGAAVALGAIDDMLNVAINAAASFGSVQGRIETQATFVSNLTDSLKAGIGSLVDADMEETSARLQALQVQQQLGIQSLSIANQAPQSVLSLFR